MAFEAITTQEQFDEAIRERLNREKEKYSGFEEYKKKAEDYDGLKEKSDVFEVTIAELNKAIDGDEETPGYKKQIEELNGKVKKYEIPETRKLGKEEKEIIFTFMSGFALSGHIYNEGGSRDGKKQWK